MHYTALRTVVIKHKKRLLLVPAELNPRTIDAKSGITDWVIEITRPAEYAGDR